MIIKSRADFAQLFLRLSLAIGFLLPVMDRFGLLGHTSVAWGNWEKFLQYASTLMPYLNTRIANFMGTIATIIEVGLAVAFVIGFRTRLASLGSFLLTLVFAFNMFFFVDKQAPFTFSVFSISAASLLLSCMPAYKWSIDNISRESKYYAQL